MNSAMLIYLLLSVGGMTNSQLAFVDVNRHRMKAPVYTNGHQSSQVLKRGPAYYRHLNHPRDRHSSGIPPQSLGGHLSFRDAPPPVWREMSWKFVPRKGATG